MRRRTFAGTFRAYPSIIEKRIEGNDHDHRKTDRRQLCSVVAGHRNMGAESWHVPSRRLNFDFSEIVILANFAAGHRVGGFFYRPDLGVVIGRLPGRITHRSRERRQHVVEHPTGARHPRHWCCRASADARPSGQRIEEPRDE